MITDIITKDINYTFTFSIDTLHTQHNHTLTNAFK